MTDLYEPFISPSFLRSAWAKDYETFLDSETEARLVERLHNWADRKDLKETSAQPAFVEQFFHETWGYFGAGQLEADKGFTSFPEYSVPGAGQTGGTGSADLALGWFEREGVPKTPQVLCEFKDIRSSLDTPQKRKGNNRSPVKQCLDYLAHARRGMFGNEPILPTWGVVSDMNEFRLYWFDRAPNEYLRFVLTPNDPLFTRSLLDTSDEGRFHRFLFYKAFHAETLLTTSGKSPLGKLIGRQWVKEREIENIFYKEYRALRDRLYKTLVAANPDFPGTKGRLIRLAQRILDRCIFIFYCEDMGATLRFPHQLLRDFLMYQCNSEYFDPAGAEIWDGLKRLFKAMNTGGLFPPDHKIECFNGGLFDDDPELEALTIPNRIFCEKGQGQNEASLHSKKDTLLYLSATYDFAAKGDASRSLGLYTLGRIFEQSITELEILEAEAEGRESLNKISKRKRDGVYYTPERVVQKIVQETLGARLADLKAECGWTEDVAPNAAKADAYWEKLKELKIIDPACGSGAFLITCLQVLLTEHRATNEQMRRFKKKLPMAEDSKLIKDILARNLYGVDINPASVEIAKLALWLHTARPGETLAGLDRHILDGNSLIDSTFYLKQDLEEFTADDRERVNHFDWWDAFPGVKARGGFDIVVSNPPYVKLQNFRKVHEDMADYLREGRQGKSYYESTQTGNFDLYLPFIEKGLSLLNENGHMGYIAPSLWTMNDYGLGLRRLLARTRQLDRWVDFGSYQVFDEATTYTALQFYTGGPNEAVRISPASDGDLSKVKWDDANCAVPYETFDPESAWIFLPKQERELIGRLGGSCLRLDDKILTSAIFQGLITSADSIYHLRRLGPGQYLCKPSEKGNDPYEVDIEDTIMKPLISGPEAKRYIRPITDTYLLFPYGVADGRATLIPQHKMEQDFPDAWRHLKSYEADLRAREGDKFNDEQWYRFGRHQNLDKQNVSKIVVPRLVAHLKGYLDLSGEFYLDNVDVGGVVHADNVDPLFLLALLNGPVSDWVFRRISKPFRGDYRSANRQFIAPLPIPDCEQRSRRLISEKARALQDGYTKLRDLQDQRAHRLGSLKVRARPLSWIFPDLGSIKDWEDDAPKTLDPTEHAQWAKDRYEEALEAHYEEIARHFRPDAYLKAVFKNGELVFLIDKQTVIDRVFLSDEDGPFIEAQWQQVADTFSMTSKTKGSALVNALRKISATDNATLRQQVIRLQYRITQLTAELWAQEKQMNELLYKAYDLTDEERRLVEAG